MFDENLIESKIGWGHSSNKALANFAMMAKVKNIVFFHYNPEYTDDKIDELLENTIKVLRKNGSDINCIASKEGLTLSL
jgi:ribonuclease BN (tRNA processing enzyme)